MLDRRKRVDKQQSFARLFGLATMEQLMHGTGVSSLYSRLRLCSRCCPASDYPCAINKLINFQGRMYISQHYVCFFSNIFGHHTKASGVQETFPRVH